MKPRTPIAPFALLIFFSSSITYCFAGNVTYDSRSLIINGRRELIISAAIHYPRSVPGMWPGLVQKAKEGGVNTIESYVFWNGHELSPGKARMYMILRIGPFVAAEYNYGGIPVWLHYIPGTVFRNDTEPFKVENEYGYYESFYGEGGKRYALWAAKMAVAQNIGVPWIMCQQFDTPDPVINTCNSFYCDQFTPHSPSMPKIWTENWPGWFKTFGGRDPHRPSEDIAFSVARFFQKGGSVHNYYMYHGGTNFGRTAGGPFITTSYDYEAPIDEYGLPRNPKWGHLKELHGAIKLCEHALLNGERSNLSLGSSQEADVYADSSGACAAFLANMDDKNDKTVVFRNVSYHLPAWSVRAQSSTVEMVPENLQPSEASPDNGSKGLKWEVFKEIAGIWGEADFVKSGFVDHINTTKDTTDYLWYTTSIIVNENEEFLKNGSRPVLLIESKGHALHAFANQELQGSASGNGTHPPFKYKNPISLKAGKNEIALLSMTVGLQNAGPFYEWVGAGITSVKITGFNSGTLDLSTYSWTYKAVVKQPPGDEPIGLDMLKMGKGLAWLNGEEIGRYWPRKSRKSSPHDECVQECDYRGKFNPDKCITGCGEPSQRWYHIPRSWFKPSENILVIFEEKGGDPTKITFSIRKISGKFAFVGEDYFANMLKLLHLFCNMSFNGNCLGKFPCSSLSAKHAY
ncbi:Beta-galactosidase 10 [Citrus sinensis]|uniref:Beta-galactosidase 10 n=1 Tax=Citrus sinensis TaxID=2711 RepID=A0ACB8JHS4_CITSI|nr:Beta-galactosidase 10 [Citrus sinensis]